VRREGSNDGTLRSDGDLGWPRRRNARCAIDIHEGEAVDESAFKALVRQAVALNSSGKSKRSKKAKP
jgi:hypothetical protein